MLLESGELYFAPPNGLAQAQRRDKQDSTAIISHFYQADSYHQRLAPLSLGADVGRISLIDSLQGAEWISSFS